MKIKIKDVVGDFCSQRRNANGHKGGEGVQEIIVHNWDKEQKFEVDFQGVKVVTPSFIDEAFGKLVRHYSLEELRNKLDFLQIDETIKDKINKSIELRLRQKEQG